MPARPAAAELLAALAPVLEAWGHRWYVFGAQAVVAYGFPRLTADVDVTAELAPDDPHGFVNAMRAAGFALRVRDVDDFVAKTRVLPFVHGPTGMPLDVVLAASGLEREFIDRAILLDVGGAVVPVIAVEDLLVTKLLAGRPKDLDDVRGIVREQGDRLDLPGVRRLLRELEVALSQSDLVASLEALLPRTRRR